MSWLDAFLTAYNVIKDEGMALVQRTVVNLTGTGVTAVDNPLTGETDVTITSGTLSGLTPDRVVVTNGSGVAVAGDGYSEGAVPETFVVRDANGDTAVSSLVVEVDLEVDGDADIAGNADIAGTLDLGGVLNLSDDIVWASGVSTPTLSQATVAGTGVTASQDLTVRAQTGRNVSGGTNNSGGNTIIASGPAGTGGTGGAAGAVFAYEGSTPLFKFFQNVPGRSVINSEQNSFQLLCSDASYYIDSSGFVQFSPATSGGGANTVYMGNNPSLTWLIPAGGAVSLTIEPTLTSFTIAPADKPTNSGTGATVTLQSQNETGTTSIGGALDLKGGEGTSVDGLASISGAGFRQNLRSRAAYTAPEGRTNFRSQELNTGGNTPTVIFTLTLPTNCVGLLKWDVLIKSSSDTKTVSDFGRVENIAGTAAVENNGLGPLVLEDAGLTTATIAAAAAGATITWTVTGIAATSIDWQLFIEASVFVP